MKRRTMQQRMANGPERLETRTLLAADVGAAGTRQLQWDGRLVEAFADAWIVRAADPAAASLALTADWRAVSLGEGFFSLTTPGAAPADVAAWAASAAGVATIEPDSVITSAAVPNDPSFGQLWGLSNTGQSGGLRDADIDAPEAWDITTGSRSVVVAVIDTGVDYAHRDLAANAWRNPGEVAGDRIDNDGNGFVDDVYGWDFANNDADPMDDQGHGTHVAGTIGAVGNNGSGVVGVSWNVSIMGLKFLGANGSGSTSGAVAAINYATRMRRDFGINIVATNNSWGGGGSSTALRDAIAAGGRAGILFVAAAGNEATNIDATPAYPVSYADTAIISVAATDRSNNLASFSNYGVTGVDLAAPGVSIYSTVPGNAYATYSGTSMATPHVTGTIALMAAANSQATAAQLRSAVISTAVPVASLAGKVATGGLLNAAAAVQVITGVQPPVDPPVDPPPPPVTADVIDVSPDPRTTSVEAVLVQFSRAVAGFDVADLALTRDGVTVSLAAASVSSTDGIRWTVAGLAAATATAGAYVLTVNAAGSGIVATDGGLFATNATDAWMTTAAALVDAGDTLTTAAAITATTGDLRLAGRVGDGAQTTRDVDLYRVRLAAGQRLVIDIDARSLAGSSTLDSYLRVFDSRGSQLAANDDAAGSLDSYLAFTARTAGTYFVGISGYGNTAYNPARAGSGRPGSTGVYQVAFGFGAVPSRSSSVRTAGFRDTTSATARHATFAAYGVNWLAALPAATPTQRRK